MFKGLANKVSAIKDKVSAKRDEILTKRSADNTSLDEGALASEGAPAPEAPKGAPTQASEAPIAPPPQAPAPSGETEPTNELSTIFTAIIMIFAIVMITLTLLVAPIAIKDVMSFSSSRVNQYNKLEKGEIVLIQDSVENRVLTYTDANSSNEPYNIYKDIGIGKIILQVAGYSMLMLLILVVLLTFLNIDNTVSGSGSSTKPTKPSGLTRLYKPLVMSVVTGVLIWAYIKFIYIDYFENSIRPYLDKTKTKVNNLNSTIASCTTTNTQLLNTIASDNEAEFKRVVSSMPNSNDVSIAITHYSIYKYFKDTVADFDNSELRKKLVGTSTTANFQYANYIRIGCSKMIRNAFYDLDIAYKATLDSNAIETTVINKMKTLNVAKTTMKSEVDLIIPKFSSYLTQRTIGASSLFLISVFILFILYGQEIQRVVEAIVRFIRSIRGGDK